MDNPERDENAWRNDTFNIYRELKYLSLEQQKLKEQFLLLASIVKENVGDDEKKTE